MMNLYIFSALCPEQSPGSTEHVTSEPSAGLCFAASTGSDENCGSRDCLGECFWFFHGNARISLEWDRNYLPDCIVKIALFTLQKILHRQTNIPTLIAGNPQQVHGAGPGSGSNVSVNQQNPQAPQAQSLVGLYVLFFIMSQNIIFILGGYIERRIVRSQRYFNCQA